MATFHGRPSETLGKSLWFFWLFPLPQGRLPTSLVSTSELRNVPSEAERAGENSSGLEENGGNQGENRKSSIAMFGPG